MSRQKLIVRLRKKKKINAQPKKIVTAKKTKQWFAKKLGVFFWLWVKIQKWFVLTRIWKTTDSDGRWMRGNGLKTKRIEFKTEGYESKLRGRNETWKKMSENESKWKENENEAKAKLHLTSATTKLLVSAFPLSMAGNNLKNMEDVQNAFPMMGPPAEKKQRTLNFKPAPKKK